MDKSYSSVSKMDNTAIRDINFNWRGIIHPSFLLYLLHKLKSSNVNSRDRSVLKILLHLLGPKRNVQGNDSSNDEIFFIIITPQALLEGVKELFDSASE